MTDPKRPDCWGFAMSFVGDPEAQDIERYVSSLEAEIERLRADAARWQRIAEVGYPPEDGRWHFIYDATEPDSKWAMTVATAWENNGAHGFSNGAESIPATHWMPVVYPEPPEYTP